MSTTVTPTEATVPIEVRVPTVTGFMRKDEGLAPLLGGQGLGVSVRFLVNTLAQI